ncbi:MAG TPA: immunoglobulin domain-containing protein, partial [Verrucomicrobiae bacterium]|nr:immunoglobulin domain-containing protein [Verrucomicrobiae bacterium]
MNNYRYLLVYLSVILFTANQGFSTILDGGVDPFNLGKGDWIWEVPETETALGTNTIQGVIDYEKNKGMQWITVKCGDGGSIWTQFDTNTVMRCHAAGMKIFAWAYVYGNNVAGEITVALNALGKGADGMIIDAEAEYETNVFNNAKAIKYCQAIKQQYPNRMLAHGPSPSVHFHPTFPYLEFGSYCDVITPQDYWGYRGITPAQMLSMMDGEFRTNLYGVWTGSATNAIKPISPVAQADQPTVAGSDESDFVHLVQTDSTPLTSAGYHGVSFWDAQEHTTNQWTAIGATNIALMASVAPVITWPPINRCINQGSNATFGVTVYGTPTMTYQWRLAGAALAGATNSSLTVANAQAVNAGNYTVVVSNGFGTVTSAVAVLTVVAPFPFLQPVFTDNFDTNSSAAWKLFQGSGNGVSDFSTNWAFNYSNQTYRTFGLTDNNAATNIIPLAPNTTNGTRLGLKITANKNDGTAATAGVSLYPAGVGVLSNCVMRFDAWINYAGGPNGETASGT